MKMDWNGMGMEMEKNGYRGKVDVLLIINNYVITENNMLTMTV